LRDDSENPNRKLRLAWALTGYAGVQASQGFNEEAIKSYEKAVELIETVSQENSDSESIRQDDLVERRELIVWLDAMSGRIDEAWAGSQSLADDWQHLLQDTGLEDVHTMTVYSTYLLDRAWLANERAESSLAESLLEKGMAKLASVLSQFPENREVGNALTLAAFRYWEFKQELPPEEILSLLPVYGVDSGRTRACIDASRAVRKAAMLGDTAELGVLVAYLLDNGYRESGLLRICKTYYFC